MRGTPLLAVAGLLASALALLPASPASAEEVYDRPADGTFEVEGHGWGHGRGMSQWGAQGAALQGRTADEITAHYYPGTVREVLPASSIRVWLTGDEGRDTVVFPAPGLRVATGAASVTLPEGPSRWRVRASSAGLHVESLTGSTWSPFAVDGRTTHAGPVRFGGPTFVRLDLPGGSSRDYRGTMTAVRDGSGLKSVVVLGLEDYLLGVVPREASAGWRPAALQAQAIAARSYSAYKRARVKAGAAYDICDTTACQVFGGSRLYSASGRVTELEPASTTAAVRATAGVVRTHQGAPVLAEFSSSSGGWSAGGNVPYLAVQEDPWDDHPDNPQHDWTAALPVSALERRFSSIGTLHRLRVTGRNGGGDWGGRVTRVVLEGSRGSVTTTGEAVRQAFPWPASAAGMRSAWFRVRAGGSAGGSEVVEQSAAPVLVRPPGRSTGSVTAVLRNTGAAAWPAEGLHLAVSSPPGQADSLAGGSTRPGRYTGTGDVPPGGTAAFQVDLDAAGAAPGTHTRVYRVRLGDGPVLGAPVTWRVVVQEARFTAARASAPTAPDARTSSDAPPAVFADGHTVVVPRDGSTTVRVSARNTGNVTWPGTGPVLLGTSGPRDRSSASAGATWPSPTRAVRLTGTAPVLPGQTGSFDVVLHGGGRPVGVTFEQFEPVWAGRHWLDGAVTRLAAVRVDPARPRLAALHSAPASLTVAKGRSTVLVVRLRNLGGQPWRVGSDQLTSSTPQRLRTSAWTSPTRPPALARNATRPGVRSVHPGEIGEWRVPLTGAAVGRHRVQLQAVVGGSGYGPRTTTTVTVR